MRFRILARLLLVVVLGLCSWFLTWRIAGQRALGHVAIGQPAPGLTKTRVAADGEAALKVPAGAVPVDSIATGHIDALTVSSGPRGVTVGAKVTLMDKRPNKSYMWGVLVRDASFDNVISTVNYKEQAFSPPRDGKVIEPTFKDVFQLPAGVYYIEVVLYDMTPGSEFGRFDPEGGPKSELSKYEKVTVSP
jgi:hypothetical protein